MSLQASVGRSGDARIDGLIFGRIWGGGSVSCSDPDSAADYGAGYAQRLRPRRPLGAGRTASRG